MNNMKIFCLLGTGRSGVDFLQTLFDQHPEVSHLPGVFYYQEFWSKLKKKNPSQIIKNIWNIKKINDDFSIKYNKDIIVNIFNEKKEIIVKQKSNSGLPAPSSCLHMGPFKSSVF